MSANQQRTSDNFLADREDDEQSIIDVFEFDDTAHDRWLCSLGNRSRRSSVESTKVEDLDAWLRADIAESEAAQSDSNSRRSIDTRTFTRIKRRSNRLNFDAVEASVSPETGTYSLANVWKNKTIPEANEQIINNNNNNKEQNLQNERRDSVPMMLRPKTNQVLAALLSESPSSISSQTSMEAFMSVARKEGNSFLLSDISDSDVSSVLMNISQPSLLYSSIISDSKGEENVHHPVVLENNSMIDSQILTDSMMEASMFKEVQDTTILAEFLKQSNDITIIEDKTVCKSFEANDQTFNSENLNDHTYINIGNKDSRSCDTTFITNDNSNIGDLSGFPSPIAKIESESTKLPSPHTNFLNSTHTIVNTPPLLNSTKVISSNLDEPESLQNDVLSTTVTINSENKTDVTFEVKSSSSSAERLDATFQTSSKQLPQSSGPTGSCGIPLDATFDTIPSLRAELLKEVQRTSGNKLNTTFTNPLLTENKLDVTYERPHSAEPLSAAQRLDATYVQVPSPKKQPESQVNKPSLDSTYDAATLSSKLSNPTGMQRMSHVMNTNSTESHAHLTDQSRFNTFRKDSKTGSRLSKVTQGQENHMRDISSMVPPQSYVPNPKTSDNSYQQRYKTFSKRTSTFKDHMSPTKIVTENKPEEKFVKPQPRQIAPPRRLSKLPQMFQKSNPNLGAKPPLGRLSMEPGVGFYKGSQPNISSNIQALGRFKSERVLSMKISTELSTSDGTSRSMESIGSTTSVLSAPDLDDIHSVASDSSRASYTIKPRTFGTLKKMGSMEGPIGKYNGSTPKVKVAQVLENTWVQEKDLPSPILKNGLARNFADSDSRSTSPTDSAEFSAKTSSPFNVSPSHSDQIINTNANNGVGIETAKENIQATENVKPKQLKAPSSTTTNKTMLRRPTNWTGASNKVANGAVSGIPRPASRIPAPRFARPNQK